MKNINITVNGKEKAAAQQAAFVRLIDALNAAEKAVEVLKEEVSKAKLALGRIDFPSAPAPAVAPALAPKAATPAADKAKKGGVRNSIMAIGPTDAEWQQLSQPHRDAFVKKVSAWVSKGSKAGWLKQLVLLPEAGETSLKLFAQGIKIAAQGNTIPAVVLMHSKKYAAPQIEDFKFINKVVEGKALKAAVAETAAVNIFRFDKEDNDLIKIVKKLARAGHKTAYKQWMKISAAADTAKSTTKFVQQKPAEKQATNKPEVNQVEVATSKPQEVTPATATTPKAVEATVKEKPDFNKEGTGNCTLDDVKSVITSAAVNFKQGDVIQYLSDGANIIFCADGGKAVIIFGGTDPVVSDNGSEFVKLIKAGSQDVWKLATSALDAQLAKDELAQEEIEAFY